MRNLTPKQRIFLFAILITILTGGFFVYTNSIKAALAQSEIERDSQAVGVNPDSAAANAAQTATVSNAAGGEAGPMAGTAASYGQSKPNEPSEWSMRMPIVFHIIGIIFLLILKLLNALVWVGANLADKILSITSFTKVNVVTIGWEITRGLANMFFALILLVMSIATILQIESFGMKALLKRLIIAALLINFSLMFAGIIIDFAQVMTDYFLTAGAGDQTEGISANLTNGLGIAQLYNFSNTQQSTLEKIAEIALGPTLQMLVEEFMAIILLLAAAFSFFAMCFFLLARIVWIWLLLIFAPLAWVSFIVPGAPGKLGSVWNDWWRNFLKWTLFAPIYAFFLYLALTIAKFGVSLNANQWEGRGAESAKALQSNFFSTPETILQYIVIIMILLGGLKAAQDMGVTGAAGAMNMVQKAGKWAGGKAKDYAKRPGQYAYDQIAGLTTQKAGGALEAIGLSKFGRRLKAKGVAMETKPEERAQHKAYANNLKTMSDLDLQEEVKHAYGIRKLLAARQAKERGLLDKTTDTDSVKKALAIFGAYGLKDEKGKTKEQRDLEDVRFDALGLDYNKKEDKEELEKIIVRSKENGNLDKIKDVVANNAEAMNAIVNTLKHETDDAFKKWGKQTKDAAKNTLKNSFTDNLTDASEIQKRKTYASITGEITAAFARKSDGKINDEGTEEMKNYINALTAAKITEIRHPQKEADLKLIGQYAKPELVNTFMRERGASAEQKMFFINGVKENSNPETKEFIQTSPGATQYQSKGINAAKRGNRA